MEEVDVRERARVQRGRRVTPVSRSRTSRAAAVSRLSGALLVCGLVACTDRVIMELVDDGLSFEAGDGISSGGSVSDDGDDASPGSTTRWSGDDDDDSNVEVDDSVDDGDTTFGTTTTMPMSDTGDTLRLDIGGVVCPDDRDCDSIPDVHDPAPDDIDFPMVASGGFYAVAEGNRLVYADSSLNVKVQGELFSSGNEVFVDIAIDPYGVMYVLAESGLFVCHAHILRCVPHHPGLTGYNGAGFVRNPSLWADETVLVVSGPYGDLAWVSDRALNPTAIALGSTSPWVSRGDIDGFGESLLMTSPGLMGGDVLVLLTGSVGPGGPLYGPIGEVPLFDYLNDLQGLAVSNDMIALFDGSGVIVAVDQSISGSVRFVATPFAFRGAAWSSLPYLSD